MEFTISDFLSIAGWLFGGGSIGGLLTWQFTRRKEKAEAEQAETTATKEVQDVYQQMVADVKADREEQKAYIRELKEDRQHLREDRDRLVERQDKTDEKVRDLQREVARNARMVEAMRPFMCADLKCKLRKRVTISEEGEVEETKTKKK